MHAPHAHLRLGNSIDLFKRRGGRCERTEGGKLGKLPKSSDIAHGLLDGFRRTQFIKSFDLKQSVP